MRKLSFPRLPFSVQKRILENSDVPTRIRMARLSERMRALSKRISFALTQLPLALQKRIMVLCDRTTRKQLALLSEPLMTISRRLSLPLPLLPLVPQKRILELFEPLFRILVSCLSRRMEILVREAKIKAPELRCFVRNGVQTVGVIGHPAHSFYMMIDEKQEERREKSYYDVSESHCFSRWEQMYKSIQEVCGDDELGPLKHSIVIMEWLEGLCFPKKLAWNFEDVEQTNWKCLLKFPQFKQTQSLEIRGGVLDSESLALLIDHLESAQEFLIKCRTPIDFKHPRSFRFPHMEFQEARWVSLEDLLSVDITRLTLWETDFDSVHLNRFLRQWQETDSEMVDELLLPSLKTDIDWNVVLEGVPSLQFSDEQGLKTALTTKKESHRKDRIGIIFLPNPETRSFHFADVAEDDFRKEKMLIQILHQKVDLEEEEQDVMTKIAELEEVNMEWNSEEGRETMRTIMELEQSRARIRRELIAVKVRLEAENVDVSDGRAMI